MIQSVHVSKVLEFENFIVLSLNEVVVSGSYNHPVFGTRTGRYPYSNLDQLGELGE